MRQLKSISISKQFYTILKDLILKGGFGVGDKLPSIRSFAQEYNISKTTVSSAISVLENEGIIEVIQGKGIYVKSKNTNDKLIGVMLFSFQEETKVEAGILKGIQQNLWNGHVLSMMDTANSMDVIIRNAEYYVNSGAQGLIMLLPKCPEPSEEEAEKLKNIIGGKVPAVFLLRDIDCPNSDFIGVDFGKGIYKAVDRLLKSGMNKIALILHDYKEFALQEVEAYKKAYYDNRSIFEPQYIKEWGHKEEIRAFLSGIINEIDALIVSDQLIYDFRGLIHKRAKSDNKDKLYLVGINSDSYTRFFDYSDITAITIKFPGESIGKAAVTRLMDRLEGRAARSRVKEVHEAE